MFRAQYSCHTLTKLDFFGQIFEKYSNIKFHEHPSNGSRRCYSRAHGQTDIHEEINSHFSP